MIALKTRKYKEENEDEEGDGRCIEPERERQFRSAKRADHVEKVTPAVAFYGVSYNRKEAEWISEQSMKLSRRIMTGEILAGHRQLRPNQVSPSQIGAG